MTYLDSNSILTSKTVLYKGHSVYLDITGRGGGRRPTGTQVSPTVIDWTTTIVSEEERTTKGGNSGVGNKRRSRQRTVGLEKQRT